LDRTELVVCHFTGLIVEVTNFIEMGKGGMVNRNEPVGTDHAIAHDKGWFQITGWFNFSSKFSGYDYDVAHAFAESFDGNRVKLGNLVFDVIEEFISKSTGFPMNGVRWFKNQSIIYVNLNNFLKPQHKDLEWKNDIPKSWLFDEWIEVIKNLEMYITYEGHYDKVYLYQMCFLCDIVGYKIMNLFYFLYKSLLKMSIKMQSHLNFPPHYVYHQGLIKILVQYMLSQEKHTWDHFLLSEGFKASSSKKRRGKIICLLN
jgi:hypothetical protein